MGAHQVAVAAACPGGGLQTAAVERLGVFGMRYGAYLHQFAVEVQHVLRPGAFVEVIDVLRYDVHVVVLFQVHERAVGGVGLRVEELAAAFVVEAVDEGRVLAEAGGRGYFHHGMVFPQAARVAEGRYAAFGAYACACGYDEKGLFHFKVGSKKWRVRSGE